MKRILGNFIIIIYVILAIAVTICLLNYNEYKVTEFGGKTLIIIDDDQLEPKYAKGDLVIADKATLTNAKPGDKIFFYSDEKIKLGELVQVNEYRGMGSTYIVEGNYQVVENDVIGTEDNVLIYNHVGTALGIIESKWGFLFLIIFPAVIAFLNEIVQVISELKSRD